MNRNTYSLVFDARRGMRVAVSEAVTLAGKSPRGGRCRAPVVAAVLALAASSVWPQSRPQMVFAPNKNAPAFNLPQPYGTTPVRQADGSFKVRTDKSFVADPKKASQITWSVDGKNATLDQGNVDRVILNWDSFDIGAGYSVHFKQDRDPTKYVSALNRIWSLDPSVILGSLTADREVILLNANGVYFGRGARVDTGKFVASALGIADDVFEKGLRNVKDGSAVFSSAGTDYTPTSRDAVVAVDAGAEIRAAAGGDVLLIAPKVLNQGRIETPSGQTVLAAGDKVYLMSSSDSKQRGLIVAVDPIKAADGSNDTTLGIVENAATGSYKTVNGATVADSTPDQTAGLVKRINEIRADSGSVNLVGLTVRQNGQINATTAVKGANGAIYLQAMASTTALVAEPDAANRGLVIEPGSVGRVGARLGTVQFGQDSVTAVRPDAGGATQLDAEVFNPSLIRAEGAAISVERGASIIAPGGKIELLASQNADRNPIFYAGQPGAGVPDDSRVVVAPGATISAAGLQNVKVDGARNQGAQRLFRIELADSPVQRSGPLYRSQVFFDARDASKISVADVTGSSAAVARTASERSTTGGDIRIEADGSVVIGDGASLDVSGGSVNYSQTTLKNTLLSQNGGIVTFRAARAGDQVDAVLSTQQQAIVPAYTEGADGGSLLLNGHDLLLAGALSGQVTQGERQRDGRSARAAPATLTIGAREGSLYYLDTIALRPAGGSVAVDPALLRDPLQGPLPALSGSVDLSLDAVSRGGFGAISLRAGHVLQRELGAIDLGIGGSLDIESRTIDLNGVFAAAGGHISLVTAVASSDQPKEGDIQLSETTRLDVAGRWTNDTALAGGARAADVQLDGGSVRVAAGHSVIARPGATIDASAGAWLAGNGALSTGKAGAIDLSIGTNPNMPASLAIAGMRLRGYDFDVGGSLTLGTPGLTIANAAVAGAEGMTLTPEFFSAGGFGNITVNAFGDVRVASGTRLAPTLANWQFAESYRSAQSGPMGIGVASPQTLDTKLVGRQPVSMSLAATRPLLFGGGSVVVERGVAIELDPGANLSLKATRDVEIGHAGGTDGQTASLSAPGGAITLGITGNRGAISVDLDPDGFLPDQAIWLGTGARLSVSGAAQLRRDGTRATFVEFRNPTTGVTPPGERVTGTVLGGGSITLAAQRGYVVAESGSVMALDGTSANLNLPGLPGAVQIAKPAGVLTVSTPEGFALDGKVSAAAPKDAAGHALADGGRLNLSVGAGGVGSTDGVSRPYPTGPRTVAIGDYDNLIAGRGAVRGADLAQSLGNGIGYVRTSMLRDAGFDALGLAAGDVVRFDTSLDLNKPLGVQLNAPAIEALPGTQVSLRSTYAQIGDASLNRGQAAAPADSSAAPDTSPQHDTSLRIVAATIDVVGKTGLRGFSSVQLDASESAIGEVRFSALEPNFNFVESLPGQLNFAGDLTIKAAQSYATTATQFTLNGMPAVDDQDPGSRLLVRGVPGGMPQRPPLSAFGSLTVNATDIEQGGVLRQPFGAITLNATRSLTLGDNSVTSVSADGATLPYGQSVNLSGWQLPLVPQPVTAMPINVGVNLNAVTLITSPTASVNARGGGDVQTWEFFPGVGGSRDYFETPGLYAVLPDYAATRALSFAGGQLSPQQAGQEIVITMPGSGLAPGRYTLLPARYALLAGELPHGAYLVSRAADQGKSVLRAPIAQDDGSVVVTASLTGAGSTNVGVPGERFVVEPAATFMAKSDIRLSNVSALLARGAAALGAARPALPIDGARVQVSVTGDAGSSWQAQLDLAAQGGQAGQLDLSAPRVALVDDLAKVSAGALGVSAKTLEDSGAGSVLLGGRRQLDASSISDVPTWRIDASGTARVDVDIGTRPMRLEELLLASSDGIRIADGTQVLANEHGTLGARTLLTQSDGALVAVSANALDLRRTDTTLTKGDLKIGAGSSLVAPQIALDATGLVQIDPGATLSASATIIGARRIVIGAGAAPDPNATVLADRLLDGVRAANDLSLHGYTSIDFIGDQNWSQRPATGSAPSVVLHSIVLDAPAIRGLATMDGVAARTDLAAQDVVIRNTNGAVPDPQMIGQGSLTVQASPPLRYGHTGGLTLGPGAIALGFDQAQLRSTGDIVLQGAGSTNAQQDLTLSAVRVTATTGAAQTINAGGALRIDGMAGGHSLGERVGQGASVTFSGTTIDQAGAVDLPGGAVAFRASGAAADLAALRFGTGSSTSVAAPMVSDPDGSEAFGSAGSIVASATQGRIELLGTLDASAARRPDGSPGQGDAGSITLQAAGAGGALVLSTPRADGSLDQASLLARAGSGPNDVGGRLVVDVTSMPRADELAQLAAAGGLTREFTLRVRSGDVSIDQSVKAQRIGIAADAGTMSVGVAGSSPQTLDATAPTGGVVQLAAGGDLVLGHATTVDARSLRAGANGGDVLLASANGRVRLDSTTVVDASGDDAQDGRIVLRAGRGADNASVKIDALTTPNLRAAEVDVEAVRVYSAVGSGAQTSDIRSIAAGNGNSGGVLGQATVLADSNAFMASAAAMRDALGIGADESGRVNLRAGVEVRASGDLTVSTDWALQAARPGGDAGFLTLRAVGNLNVNGSLSDGFTTANAAGVLNDNARSWSMRLTAGADLSAADPLGVLDLSMSSADVGNVNVAAGKFIRAGAGSIEIAAGRDVTFGDGFGLTAPGLAYVAGRKLAGSAAVLSSLFAQQAAKPNLTEHGGRLEVAAARDVVAPEATQLINNWLWRSGLFSTRPGEDGLYNTSSQLAWWPQFARFGQTLGSFGGADLSISAGRDVVNLQAMVPTAGWADSRVAATATIQVIDGGDLTVDAGRDIRGGQFLLGRGVGRLYAGGAIDNATSNVNVAAPLLAMLAGQWQLSARSAVTASAPFDPTAVPAAATDNRGPASGFFYTWGADTALRIVSNSGAVNLLTGVSDADRARGLGLDSAASDPLAYFQVQPASLTISALGGDIELLPPGSQPGSILFPSASGQLALWSGGDIRLGGAQRGGLLAMADADPTSWPDAQRPISRSQGLVLTGLIADTLGARLSSIGLHAVDTEPAHIHADGSLEIRGASNDTSTLVLPKPAQVYAGEDALELSIAAQNLRPDDRTTIDVGRNYLAGQFGSVVVAGPGSLEISAGRSIDLGSSGGFTTIGNQRNAGLMTEGASVRLAAATAGTLDLAAFSASYLQASIEPSALGSGPRSQQYRDALVADVQGALKVSGLSYDQAWAFFRTFPPEAQTAFARQVLAAEFGAQYLSGPAPTIAQVTDALHAAFDARKAQVVQAAADALAADQALTLPGREVLQGASLSAYLGDLRGLSFASLDVGATVAARAADLAAIRANWRETVAATFGKTAAEFDALAASDPRGATVLAYQTALNSFSGRTFESYRDRVVASEVANAGAAASQFGRKGLPMRLALFDQGFQVAELGGLGSFAAQPVWPGGKPVLSYAGALDMTQSSVITERGGDITLLNPGGAINVGLKEISGGAANAPKGVIALGGGDVFGFARDDFQVNTQRVFIVGQGDMNIWSSSGDIDSGRGANTAVAAPPLVARRSVDGVVFEVPATTSGSGLAILDDASGKRSGSIGLYPAFGEILALDAFIRAPVVRLGSSVKGADNIQAPTIAGATAQVSAPTASATPPPAPVTPVPDATAQGNRADRDRQASSLLTVELLGLGSRKGADAQEECDSATDAAGCGATGKQRPGRR